MRHRRLRPPSAAGASQRWPSAAGADRRRRRVRPPVDRQPVVAGDRDRCGAGGRATGAWPAHRRHRLRNRAAGRRPSGQTMKSNSTLPCGVSSPAQTGSAPFTSLVTRPWRNARTSSPASCGERRTTARAEQAGGAVMAPRWRSAPGNQALSGRILARSTGGIESRDFSGDASFRPAEIGRFVANREPDRHVANRFSIAAQAEASRISERPEATQEKAP